MNIQRDLAIQVTRHLRIAIGYACTIGAGFACIAMGILFIGASIIGLTGAWFALYKLEEYFGGQYVRRSTVQPGHFTARVVD